MDCVRLISIQTLTDSKINSTYSKKYLKSLDTQLNNIKAEVIKIHSIEGLNLVYFDFEGIKIGSYPHPIPIIFFEMIPFNFDSNDS